MLGEEDIREHHLKARQTFLIRSSYSHAGFTNHHFGNGNRYGDLCAVLHQAIPPGWTTSAERWGSAPINIAKKKRICLCIVRLRECLTEFMCYRLSNINKHMCTPYYSWEFVTRPLDVSNQGDFGCSFRCSSS